MSKKLYWGLGVLVFLICTAFVFMTVRNRAEIRQLETEFADAKELETHLTEQPKADNKPPREAKAGFEWEWHGDHWHEMPVAQNDVPQQTPIVADIEPALVDGEIDFKVKLPTDAELPTYNKRELSILVHDAIIELSDTQKKYVALTSSLRDARWKNFNDMKAGLIDSNTYWAKWKEINFQARKINSKYNLLRPERKKEIEHVEHYRDSLYEGIN